MLRTRISTSTRLNPKSVIFPSPQLIHPSCYPTVRVWPINLTHIIKMVYLFFHLTHKNIMTCRFSSLVSELNVNSYTLTLYIYVNKAPYISNNNADQLYLYIFISLFPTGVFKSFYRLSTHVFTTKSLEMQWCYNQDLNFQIHRALNFNAITNHYEATDNGKITSYNISKL